jgi:hypothetical protein
VIEEVGYYGRMSLAPFPSLSLARVLLPFCLSPWDDGRPQTLIPTAMIGSLYRWTLHILDSIF